MPAVCRFFIKGHCRYGRNCRFEHLGENDHLDNNQSGGFSFARALEETRGPFTQTASTDFSFTQALNLPGPTLSSTLSGHYQQRPQSTNLGFNQSYQSHYNQPATNFSFTQALNPTASPFNSPPQPLINPNSFGLFNQGPFSQQQQQQQPQQQFAQQSTSIFGSVAPFGQSIAQAPNQSFLKTENKPSEEKHVELTPIELKAYNSDKFEFRLIPVRPPPENLCR